MTSATITVSVVKDVSIGISSSNTADFPFTTSCSVSLPAGSSCRIVAQFQPVMPGDRSAWLKIASTAGDTAIALSGSATGEPLLPERDPTFSLVIAGSEANPVSIAARQRLQLRAVAIPVAGGESADVTSAGTWVSSDPIVATVTSGGLIEALAGGNASISVSYRGHTAFLRVLVIVGS